MLLFSLITSLYMVYPSTQIYKYYAVLFETRWGEMSRQCIYTVFCICLYSYFTWHSLFFHMYSSYHLVSVHYSLKDPPPHPPLTFLTGVTDSFSFLSIWKHLSFSLVLKDIFAVYRILGL